MKTTDFLDLVKEKHGLTSDYQLFKFLDVGQSTVSAYRVGKQFFSDEIAIKVAGLVDLPPGYVLACVHAERSKRPDVKQAWDLVAKISKSAAAGLLIALLSMFSHSTTVEAAGLVADKPVKNNSTIIYIMRNVARWWGYFVNSIKSLFSQGFGRTDP